LNDFISKILSFFFYFQNWTVDFSHLNISLMIWGLKSAHREESWQTRSSCSSGWLQEQIEEGETHRCYLSCTSIKQSSGLYVVKNFTLFLPYSLHTQKTWRLGQRHGLQNTTLTSYFSKNIYQKVIYVYFYKSIFQDKSIHIIFIFSNSITWELFMIYILKVWLKPCPKRQVFWVWREYSIVVFSGYLFHHRYACELNYLVTVILTSVLTAICLWTEAEHWWLQWFFLHFG